MKKVSIPQPGGYDQLKFVDLPIPEPKAGEALVQVAAIGINYADICVRWGIYESAKKYCGYPITPGFEFSGTVVSLGPHTPAPLGKTQTKFPVKVGSEVFGVTRFGAYASHIVVPLYQLFPLPKNLTLIEAAGFPAVWLTAAYGLDLAATTKGQRVLVHSAAGGVGSCLVQFARAKGCVVVGVVGSSHKVQACAKLGAHHENLWQKAKLHSPDGYHSVFDANGVETLRSSYEHLGAGGRLVVYGFHSMLPRIGGVLGPSAWAKITWDWLRTPTFDPLQMTAFNLSYLFDMIETFQHTMDLVWDLVDSGTVLGVPYYRAFPFEEVAAAHKLIESGKSIGKIILVVDHKKQ